jgi:hypothetical protein
LVAFDGQRVGEAMHGFFVDVGDYHRVARSEMPSSESISEPGLEDVLTVVAPDSPEVRRGKMGGEQQCRLVVDPFEQRGSGRDGGGEVIATGHVQFWSADLCGVV